MAISLNKKREPGLPMWAVVIISAIVIVILLFLGSYVYFVLQNKKMADEVQRLEIEAADYENKIRAKEGEVFLLQQRITDFKNLVLGHKELTKIFSFLEAKTMPSIFLKSFDFNNIEKEGVVILDGIGPSFLAVGQQIEILKKEEALENIALSSISINENGEISFALKLIFKQKFFSLN